MNHAYSHALLLLWHNTHIHAMLGCRISKKFWMWIFTRYIHAPLGRTLAYLHLYATVRWKQVGKISQKKKEKKAGWEKDIIRLINQAAGCNSKFDLVLWIKIRLIRVDQTGQRKWNLQGAITDNRRLPSHTFVSPSLSNDLELPRFLCTLRNASQMQSLWLPAPSQSHS